MKNTLTLFVLVFFLQFTAKAQTPLPFNFAFEVDDTGFNTTYDITTDALGNVYVTGGCSSSADMDPSNAVVLAGEGGLFVAKYSSSGAYLWHKIITNPLGSFGYGLISAIRITQNNDIILSGYYNGTLDFDPNAGVELRESVLFVAGPDPECNPEIEECCEPESGDCPAVHTDDIFVLSLDASGNFKWVNTYGGFGRDEVEKIDIDSNNDIIVASNYENNIDIGSDTYTAAGVSSALCIKIDTSGALLNSFDLPTSGRVLAVTCDENGNFYIATRFNFSVDFDPGTGTALETSSGSNDVAIVKFNNLMAFQWVKVFSGAQSKSVYDLTTDPSGNIVGIGAFAGTMNNPTGPAVASLNSVGLSDAFLFKMNPTGSLLWSKALQGINSCIGIAVTTNSLGHVFGIGYYKFTVDFNPDAANFPMASNGENDIFQVTLNQNGAFLGAFSYGDTFDDYGTAITSDNFDRVISAGWYKNGSVDFNPAPAGSTVLTTASNAAVFVQSLGLPNASCPEDLVINSVTTSTDYFTSDFIEGNGMINAPMVNFQAANYVLLSPGFNTGSSTVFTAELGVCP